MNSIILQLKTRIVVLSTLVFLLVALVSSLLAGRLVLEHSQKTLLQQQAYLQQLTVNSIDTTLQKQMDALQALAKQLHDGDVLMDLDSLQKVLDSRIKLHNSFNGGLIVMNAEARMIVDSPVVKGRVGVDLSDREHVQKIKATHQPMITHPLLGRGLQSPVFVTFVPIISNNNQLIGYLMGVTRLADSNLLTHIAHEVIGGVGTLYVIDFENNVFVTSTRTDLALQPLPTFEQSEVLKQVAAGTKAGVAQSFFDQRVAFSAQKSGLMNWYVVHTKPISVFNQTTKQLLNSLAWVGGVAALFFALLVYLVMRHQLKPVEQSADKIRDMMAGRIAQSPLPVKIEDEVGVLINAFNQQVDQLNQEASSHIRQLNANFLAILANSTDYIYFKDDQGRMQFCSQNLSDLTGYSSWREMIGKTDTDLFPADIAKVYAEEDRIVYQQGRTVINRTSPFETQAGKRGWVQTNKWPVFSEDGNDVIGLFGISRDITDQWQSELQLRIAANVFESQEGMMVTDVNGVILKVNQAFTEITGYSSEEAVGANPNILKSGRQSTEFYASMWHCIQDEGRWEGEIWNRRKQGEVYPEYLRITAVKDQNGTLTNYVGTSIDITQSKAAAQQIESLAFYDPLTNLPNRRLFMERLNHALNTSARKGHHGALLFMDLDHFKTLNDTQGHHVGDLLLQQVAARLKSSLREGDTAARLGGDEFVVLLESLNQNVAEAVQQVEQVANKIHSLLINPYQLDELKHIITPSIGVMIFNSHDQEAGDLLQKADIAMYQAKAQGRDTIRFFDPKMQEDINTHEMMRQALLNAIEGQQFELYYQIQVDSHGASVGAEALIRWNHPERGLILPHDFIPLAEENRLIIAIGQWVLETVCSQLNIWQHQLSADFFISINVSAVQFKQADFVDKVLSTLKQYAVDATRLKLELTESMLLEDLDDTIKKMHVLSQAGIRISLDDFGTGYSSLRYLKLLSIDQLKIDQSFVCDIDLDKNDRAIVKTIINVTQGLEIDVIAEGVETQTQRAFLFDNGCMHYQGYLFSKPVPLAEFEALLTLEADH